MPLPRTNKESMSLKIQFMEKKVHVFNANYVIDWRHARYEPLIVWKC